jgi:hypothetical protein
MLIGNAETVRSRIIQPIGLQGTTTLIGSLGRPNAVNPH